LARLLCFVPDVGLAIWYLTQLALFERAIFLYTGLVERADTAVNLFASQCRHLQPARNPGSGSPRTGSVGDAERRIVFRRNVIKLKPHQRRLLQNRTPWVCTLSENTIVTPEILIVREDNGYRLLHGQLHLTSALCLAPSVKVKVSGEGEALVYWDRHAILVEKDGQKLPLHRT
jgi:hypothetical protein